MNNRSCIQKGEIYMYEENIEICNCNIIHQDVVRDVKNNIPNEKTLYELAELFKVLSDCTRVKILYALLNAEMCVCDIAALLGMTQSAISHQLRVLKQSRLVKHRRDGKVVYYSLDDEHVKQIFDQGLIHIRE
jgi:ArsR family transcriptional regulator, lead/cadmium/zinc/bismuth-responsive transcriptional repressor